MCITIKMVNASSSSNTSSSIESNGSLDTEYVLETIKNRSTTDAYLLNGCVVGGGGGGGGGGGELMNSSYPRRIVKIIRNHNVKPKTSFHQHQHNSHHNKTLSYSSNSDSTRSTPLILRNYNLINRVNHDFDFIMKSELGFDKTIFGPFGYKRRKILLIKKF